MANTSAIWQQAAHTTYQLSSPSCSTRAIQKSLTINKKDLRVFWKKSQKNGQKKAKTERARGLGRRNKRGDRKGESNDSREIPDRRQISDTHGLLSGMYWWKLERIMKNTQAEKQQQAVSLWTERESLDGNHCRVQFSQSKLTDSVVSLTTCVKH